jgi:hypothetical protein
LKCNFNGEWNIGKWRCPVTIGTKRLDATKSKEKGLFVSSDPTPCFIFSVHIKTLDCKFFNEALLDTGASAYFMDKDFALKHSLELIGKAHLAPVEIIDGRSLASRNVMEEIQHLEIMLGNQVSHVVFNIIQCPANPLVLGLLWFDYITLILIGVYEGFFQNKKIKWKKYIQPLVFGTRVSVRVAKENVAFAIYATPMDTSIEIGV